MTYSFKKTFSFEARKTESTKILVKYPDKIPIIVEKAKGSTLDNIDKHKFLVPHDMTVGQFIYILRKRIELSETEALYIFVDKTLPMTSQLVAKIYEDYKTKNDFDGFLYIQYCNENTFGN
tara:strand:+ start:1744 stop:2106 length:363 start_codon:yes stop_codon:yes gene_type:complete